MIDIGYACLLMGLAIGIDVALATFLRANAMVRASTIFIWITGVTLTHTLFPLLGYLLAYFGITQLPILTPLIGLIAFSFIAYFIFQEITKIEEREEHNQLLVTLGLILAVSWDALWSGPAKSAQVVGWPEYWVWLSFIIVGVVVMLCAIFSLLLAKLIARISIDNQQFLMVLSFLKNNQPAINIGQWMQLSIVGYFGLLALLRYTFSLDVNEWKILVLALVTIASILYRQENREPQANSNDLMRKKPVNNV
mgnify:CR=1 FL=1